MAFEITMPVVGLMMDTGTITRWLKKEGDAVTKGEEISEMETDKMSSPIEAPADGVLLKILAPEGTELPPGALLGFVGNPGEDVGVLVSGGATRAAVPAQVETPGAFGPGAFEPGTQAATQCEKGGLVRISPLAKKIARDNGLEYSALTGSGPQGRIVRKDVEQALAAVPVVAPIAAPAPVAAVMPCEGDEVIPYSGMRKAVGENMSRSWQVAPRVTHNTNVHIGKLLEVRAMINEGREKEKTVSVTDLLVRVVARSLKLCPFMNASLSGNRIIRHGAINIGVAVAVERGLVVPVIQWADKKTLDQVRAEIRQLAEKARNGGLAAEEMQSGTFTISNLGAYNSVDHFSPIINQPESAILGVGRTVDTLALVNGVVVSRPLMGLSLTFDHRVIDGAPAAEYLRVLMDIIEDPIKYLL